MNNLKPGPLLMLGGGVLMVLASFLDWRAGSSGLSTDSMGLFGIFTLLAGAALAAVGGIRSFAPQTSLPDHIAGFSLTQVCIALGFIVFLWTFALVTADVVDAGVHLAWIGAATATAGGVVASLDKSPAGPASPPQQF